MMRLHFRSSLWSAIWLSVYLSLVLVSGWVAVEAGTQPYLDDKVQFSATGLATPVRLPDERLLFRDDFATYSGRWQLVSTPKVSVDYRDDTLWMRVMSPGVSVWSVPDFRAAMRDYRASTVVQSVHGVHDSWIGFVVDYLDADHFTAALFSGDGEGVFERYEAGTWLPVEGRVLEGGAEVESIWDAERPVELAVEVRGETVTLFFDGSSVTESTLDRSVSIVSAGLIVRSGHGHVNVGFDRFQIVALE